VGLTITSPHRVLGYFIRFADFRSRLETYLTYLAVKRRAPAMSETAQVFSPYRGRRNSWEAGAWKGRYITHRGDHRIKVVRRLQFGQVKITGETYSDPVLAQARRISEEAIPMRIPTPNTLKQELFCGLTIAVGVVTVGGWGLLANYWHLGPLQTAQRLLYAELEHQGLIKQATSAPAPAVPMLASQPDDAAHLPLLADPASRAIDLENELGDGKQDGHWEPQTVAKQLSASKPLPETKQPVAAVSLPPASALLLAGAPTRTAEAPKWPIHPMGAQGAPTTPPKGAASIQALAAERAENVKLAAASALATKPVAAPMFPAAPPVVHDKLRSPGRHSASATRFAYAGLDLLAAGVPGRDRSAAASPGAKFQMPDFSLAATGRQAAQVAGLEASSLAAPTMSPGTLAELAESRSAERTAGIPENPTSRQRLAVRRRLLDHLASPHLVAHPTTLLAEMHHRAAAIAPQRHHVAASAPTAIADATANRGVRSTPVGLPTDEARASTSGVVFHTVSLTSGASVHQDASGAQLGEPLYDASTRTLRMPLAGHLRVGPLQVHHLDNGRAYVDVAGAQPTHAGVSFVNTPDGTFKKGAISGRPDRGDTRLSFELAPNALMNASVEKGSLVIRAIPGRTPPTHAAKPSHSTKD
jgi:hypothetical protein